MRKVISNTLMAVLFLVFGICVATHMYENNNLLNDTLEIERKWLIDKEEIGIDLSKADEFDILQTYINYSPEIRVREITYDNTTYHTMTVKQYVNDKGLTRVEYDFRISEDDYKQTVVKGLDNTIHKTRYQIDVNGLTYSFDIFHDNLDGLAYMEIEFDSEEDANNFKEPEWIIKDITDDRRYKNQSLAQFGIPTEVE